MTIAAAVVTLTPLSPVSPSIVSQLVPSLSPYYCCCVQLRFIYFVIWNCVHGRWNNVCPLDVKHSSLGVYFIVVAVVDLLLLPPPFHIFVLISFIIQFSYFLIVCMNSLFKYLTLVKCILPASYFQFNPQISVLIITNDSIFPQIC